MSNSLERRMSGRSMDDERRTTVHNTDFPGPLAPPPRKPTLLQPTGKWLLFSRAAAMRETHLSIRIRQANAGRDQEDFSRNFSSSPTASGKFLRPSPRRK